MLKSKLTVVVGMYLKGGKLPVTYYCLKRPLKVGGILKEHLISTLDWRQRMQIKKPGAKMIAILRKRRELYLCAAHAMQSISRLFTPLL